MIIVIAMGQRGHNRGCTEIVLLNQSREDLKGLRASVMETGKANHSDPYTRPPQGGCILYFFCLANILSTTAAALFSEFQRSIL